MRGKGAASCRSCDLALRPDRDRGLGRRSPPVRAVAVVGAGDRLACPLVIVLVLVAERGLPGSRGGTNMSPSHHRTLSKAMRTHLGRRRPRRPGRPRSRGDDRGFPAPVLGIAGADRPDPPALADDPALSGPRRDTRVPGRRLCSVRPRERRLFLGRLAVPQRHRPGADGAAARHDDPDRARDLGRLLLFERGRLRSCRRAILLGARHPHRRHAARPLDRDALGHGRLARAREPGSACCRRARSCRAIACWCGRATRCRSMA